MQDRNLFSSNACSKATLPVTDELSIPEKVRLDAEHRLRRSCGFDLRIMLHTVWRAIAGHGVAH